MKRTWSELKQKFSVYDPNQLVEVTEEDIHQLVGKVESLLDLISTTSEFEATSDLFDELLGAQVLGATLLWKYRLQLPTKLEKFVREFDRGDTEEIRKFVFSKLKQGPWPGQ